MERNAARSSAWPALHLSLTLSSGHLATHHAPFSATAFCKVQLLLRRCGSGTGAAELQCVERNAARSSAWQALHLNFNI